MISVLDFFPDRRSGDLGFPVYLWYVRPYLESSPLTSTIHFSNPRSHEDHILLNVAYFPTVDDYHLDLSSTVCNHE